jgi:hypothetical protein
MKRLLKISPFLVITFTVITLISSCREEATIVNTTEEDVVAQNELELQVFNWFEQQQLSNGLLESTENGNIVSLYDNALAAMVFLLRDDFEKAEKIFDFFNARIDSELKNGVGGFSQFRDRAGNPNNHRWMGDNAWLLIALNNYKAQTGNTQYDILAQEITAWLIGLQDADGGLFAGYNTDGSRMNFKVTEGNIDAFNAVKNYTPFHRNLLAYLENHRWNASDKNLVAWPENPPYLYALDLHSWSYLLFPNYPISALTTAERHRTSQTASTSGLEITGYCFDEDQDVVWLEGTGQMALAFDVANMLNERDFYLTEMEKNSIASTTHSNASGFPYTSNQGTTYGSDMLWNGADDLIAISGGAWYLFAKYKFNPFAVGRNKVIPLEDQFWRN